MKGQVGSTWSLGFRTLDKETSLDELPVRGVVPPWLTGSLVRVTPARFEVGNSAYNHWFDGLAMLYRFGFSGGRVAYANRYLSSRTYREAMEMGRITRGEFATTPRRTLLQRLAVLSSAEVTDNCNVNIVRLAGQVVAFTETRLPLRFDPDKLETLGRFEHDARIKGPISTAHPHHDRVRGRFYSYMLEFGPRSRYHLFSIDPATGQEATIATIPIRRPAYMHSFGMTQRYLVLTEFPLVVNPLRLLLSSKPFIRNYTWEPRRGVRFHIIDKETGAVRTAQSEAFFAFHHLNAFEEGDALVVDIVTYPDPGVIDQLYLDRLRSGEPVTAVGSPTRFRIGASGEVTHRTLSETSLELPRFNYGRLAGRPYRYVYGAGNAVRGNFLDSLVKLDLDRGTTVFWHEEGCYPGEPVFTAAPGDASEDAGVILSVVLDIRRGISFLLILDASSFRELARAEVPHPIPFGFHGSYLAEDAEK